VERAAQLLDNQMDRGAGTIRARAPSEPGLFRHPRTVRAGSHPGPEQHVAILIPDGAVVTDQSRKVVMTVKETHCRAKSCVRGQ